MTQRPLQKRNRLNDSPQFSPKPTITAAIKSNPVEHSQEQLDIINTKARYVVVSAVAGSAKTYTMVERIRHLIASGVIPSSILVLSFSNKAVDVVRDRLGSLTGVKVSTFHAFGKEMVEQHASSTGRRIKLASNKKSLQFLGAAIASLPKTCKRVRQLAGINLKTKAECRRLFAFFASAQSDAIQERLVAEKPLYADYELVLDRLQRIHRRYNRLMADADFIDYPEMLTRGALALADQPLPYRYLFVDEFQDMNAAQARLLSALASKVRNVMVFGDRQQSVYSFMGSQFHSMREVLGASVKSMRLSQSFRLTQETSALANAILRKDWVASKRRGAKPTFHRCSDMTQQEQKIVALVEELLSSGVPIDSIAILGRTKAQLRAIEQALRASGQATNPLYDERLPQHTKRLLRLLSVLCVNAERLGLGPKLTKTQCTILERKLSKIARCEVPAQVLAACRRMFLDGARVPTLPGRYTVAMKVYLKLIRAGGADMTGVQKDLQSRAPMAASFEDAKALRKAVTKLDSQPGVVLSTIHSAKGDEWDHVVVAGITEGSIPFFLSRGRGGVAEERRLFYVAVTRARVQAHLLQTPFSHAPSGQRFDQPSRFMTRKVKRCLANSKR